MTKCLHFTIRIFLDGFMLMRNRTVLDRQQSEKGAEDLLKLIWTGESVLLVAEKGNKRADKMN
jgi:hypothetical protein